jgi:hypothetical protein
MTELLARPATAAADAGDHLGLCLLAVWFGGLTFATPLYHPYPRLALPWLVAACLGAGALAGGLARRNSAAASPAPSGEVRFRPWMMTAAVAAIVACGVMAWRAASGGAAASAWQPRTGLRHVAQAMLQDTERVAGRDSRPPPRVVLVYGEPALVYHLNALQNGRPDRAMVFPVANLDVQAPPQGMVFLAASLHARRSPEFLEELAQHQDRFSQVADYRYRASDLVLADQFPPHDWAGQRVQSAMLYRVK